MTAWTDSHLPATHWTAILRGIRGHCPRCDARQLFPRFLRPTVLCPGCGQDWTLHRADDFPPYVSIILTGHIMAPVLIEVGSSNLPLWACLFLAGHLLVMGYSGWLPISGWPGWMPPITLISFICVLLSLILFWSGKSRAA